MQTIQGSEPERARPNRPAPIRRLEPLVAERIAAGEVIVQPASVVKELLENALDAGGARITIRIAQGGRQLIEVADDGCGIRYDELPLAIERHATSKISAVDDLHTIRTFGFRGEALPSMAAVGTLRISSRVADEPAGGLLMVEHGRSTVHEPCGHPCGTTVRLEALFANLPARRKFLKDDSREFARIHEVVRRQLLAYPQVHCQIEHNGRMVARYPAVNTLVERVRQILGDDWHSSIALESEQDERANFRVLDNGVDHIRYEAMVSNTRVSFATRKQQFLFLNGRPIEDRNFSFVLREVYRGLLMEGRHPGAVMLLSMDPSMFDVNVHPAKTEVRFIAQRELWRWLRHELRIGIVGQTRYVDRPETNPTFPSGSQTSSRKSTPQPEPLTEGRQAPLLEDAQPQTATRSFSFRSLHYFGQLAQSYLITAHRGRIILIDQHAAHERVRYEEIRSELAGQRQASQQLMQPRVFAANDDLLKIVSSHAEQLVQLGFDLELVGDGTIRLRGLPSAVRSLSEDEVVEVLLECSGLPAASGLSELQHKLAAHLACRSAIRFHRKLDVAEVEALFTALDACEVQSNCPHGRPLYVELDQAELERRFGRVGKR